MFARSDSLSHEKDPWSAKVNSADGHEHSIIHSSAESVATYLRNIDMLWELGVKAKSRP
jgi:hypothetical protein